MGECSGGELGLQNRVVWPTSCREDGIVVSAGWNPTSNSEARGHGSEREGTEGIGKRPERPHDPLTSNSIPLIDSLRSPPMQVVATDDVPKEWTDPTLPHARPHLYHPRLNGRTSG